MINPARPARRRWGAALLGLAALGGWLGPPREAGAVSPELAAAASVVFPGAGQALQGNFGEGALYGGLFLGSLAQYGRFVTDPRYIPVMERDDPAGPDILINRTTLQADFFYFAAQNLSLYSAFAAYRDGRRALENKGRDTPPPGESLSDLALAPFQPEFLLRPLTLVALALPLYVAISPRNDGRYLYRPDDTLSWEQIAAADAGINHMVAVGEEAFFRGVLNTSLSDRLGRYWGLAASSLLFGSVHQGEAGQAGAVSATLYGAFLGYLQQENDYDIRQGVAIHFWWNVLVSLGLLGERDAGQIVPLAYVHFRF